MALFHGCESIWLEVDLLVSGVDFGGFLQDHDEQSDLVLQIVVEQGFMRYCIKIQY